VGREGVQRLRKLFVACLHLHNISVDGTDEPLLDEQAAQGGRGLLDVDGGLGAGLAGTQHGESFARFGDVRFQIWAVLAAQRSQGIVDGCHGRLGIQPRHRSSFEPHHQMKRTTDSYEAAHAALNIIEILSGIAACLAERGLGETGDFEPEDLRNASQCSSLWLHAFRPFSYRDVYLGPSLYKGGDPNRTALRFLDLLEMTGCNRHVRTFRWAPADCLRNSYNDVRRVAFTRLTTRSRSSAHDEGPRPEIVGSRAHLGKNSYSIGGKYPQPVSTHRDAVPELYRK
jgi:hypothetical protein